MADLPEQDLPTKTPDPSAKPAGALRLLVFWEGGFASHALAEPGRFTLGRASSCGIVINHESVSRVHAALHVGAAGEPVRVEDLGSANGTRMDGEALAPNRPTPVRPGGTVEIGSVMLVVQQPNAAEPPAPADGAESPMRRLEDVAVRIARSTITVLLLGETGVGKGVLAESIHRRSQRADRPFLPLNCGALPESLVDGELFGHEKGAFTGATARSDGLIESADGGTVFLDEVGELPLATQVKLLRVLENREVLRVGGRQPVPVDVRFIAATNRDLEALIAEQRFRKDLFFRLDGVRLTVPPLRERLSEIPDLAAGFAAKAAEGLGQAAPAISQSALDVLRAHPWPGNVRELRNVIERAVLLSGGTVLRAEHLEIAPSPDARTALQAPPDRTAAAGDAGGGLRSEVDDFERRRILDALDKVAGNQSRAAKLLGVSRRTLVRRLAEYGINRPHKSDDDED